MSFPQFIYRRKAVRNLTNCVEAICILPFATEILLSKYIFMSFSAGYVTIPQAVLSLGDFI